ncbi:MAG: PRC-barrel domain-containing protein [Candidatus Promineifilaceae bacterium]|nr:PRC-barrel domain-containing protein [Candidatus Promineifilaceae bacterium]
MTLRRASRMIGHRVRGEDGDLGTVGDLYFDEVTWELRYVVVALQTGLDERRVLLAPPALESPRWDSNILPVRLSREQVAQAPPVGSEQPISRQYEIDLYDYYGWPAYWGQMTPTGFGAATPYRPLPAPAFVPGDLEPEANELEAVNPRLRSAREVLGYEVEAKDGDVGSLDDLIVDDERWAIFYMVVDTGSWLSEGKKVLLAPTWVTEINWPAGELAVDLPREMIRESPPFDPLDLVERAYEEELYSHYRRRPYWKPETPENP